MFLGDINKHNVENLIDNFLLESYKFSKDNKTFFVYKEALLSLINWESLSEEDIKKDIIQRLRSLNAKKTFIIYRMILRRFFEYYDIDCDLSSVKFNFVYFDFDTIQHHIELLDDLKELQRRDANKLLMSRLCAYLLWLGIDRPTMESLQRKDYNVKNQILTTIHGEYDLHNPLYADCAMHIANELQLNVQNSFFVFDNDTGKKEYLLRYNILHPVYDRESVTYKHDDNSYVMRTKNAKEICFTTSKHICNRKLIYKSGLFYKLMLYEQMNEIIVTKHNIDEIVKKLKYTIKGDGNLLGEFTNYKRFF